MTELQTRRRTRVPFWVQVFRPLGYLWLWAMNIRIVGEMPDEKKFVIIAAPHKTNWDLPNALAAALHFGVRIHWMGKDSLFKWPFGAFMRWLGGIPVDRSKRNNAVGGMVERFQAADELIVVIPPEGTRSDVERWKSGFYYIAHGAGVPIVMAFVDYGAREIGIKGVFHTTGDYEADLKAIQDHYEFCLPKVAA